MDKEIIISLQKLEARYQNLKIAFISLGALFLVSLAIVAFLHSQETDIIRAKGIVIEDASGRDRILIGSPVPYSKDRVRTDTALVRKYWAKNYNDPAQFMNWYKAYHHATEGMVVLNENGFYRVQIGDRLTDANSGKRQFEAAGIIWNDSEGWEKGGAGVNTMKDGKSRSVIGLDDSEGEAVHLVSLEDGTKGLIVGGDDGRLLFGMSKKNGQWFQNKSAFAGMKFFDYQGRIVREQQMNQPD